jgi:hypothetical protein
MLGEILQRVLNDALPVEEVQLTKAITKPLKDYVVKKKGDGTDGSQPPHVRVAKMLADRGQDVGEGTRIAYVVLDGDGGINAPIPADDYDGNFDRYYLWESLVYPPTQRLLQAAFPDRDWVAGLERIRPPKPRGKAAKVAEGQLGLSLGGKVDDFVLPIHEDIGSASILERVKEVAKRHPGGKNLVLHVCLRTGAVAVISTPLKVSGSPAFLLEVEQLFWEAAASRDWEARCAS